MKKSTLQVRLFLIEWPLKVERALLLCSYLNKKENNNNKNKTVHRLANWVCISYEKKKKKKLKNFVLFVSFFFHVFSPHLQLWSAARVFFPTIPQSFVMFCFTMLASQIDLYFWNRMPDYFATARRAYINRLSKFMYNYVVIVMVEYWATWELSKNIIFAMETNWRQRNETVFYHS